MNLFLYVSFFSLHHVKEKLKDVDDIIDFAFKWGRIFIINKAS